MQKRSADVWTTSAQVMAMAAGDAEEHAHLLAGFFLEIGQQVGAVRACLGARACVCPQMCLYTLPGDRAAGGGCARLPGCTCMRLSSDVPVYTSVALFAAPWVAAHKVVGAHPSVNELDSGLRTREGALLACILILRTWEGALLARILFLHTQKAPCLLTYLFAYTGRRHACFLHKDSGVCRACVCVSGCVRCTQWAVIGRLCCPCWEWGLMVSRLPTFGGM